MDQNETARLVELLRKARIQSLEKLLDKVEQGTASASDYTALLRAANEVEAMLPSGSVHQSEQLAGNVIAAEDCPFLPDDETADYDPESPLIN